MHRDPVDRWMAALFGVALTGSIVSGSPAAAQVSMDNSALDALRTPQPHVAAPARRRPPSRPPIRSPAQTATQPSETPSAAAPSKPAAAPTAAARPVKPTIPLAPPAIAALPPPIVVPLEHPPPLPTVPLANDAPGAATPIAGGLRVTFGPDRADLNPATVDALRTFAHAQANQSDTSINIYAYATGRPEDPSTPRRLSLERAMAARAVLMNEGVPSPRIYPRALGPTGGSTDPDRVDVTTGSHTPPPVTLPVTPPVTPPVTLPTAPPRGSAG